MMRVALGVALLSMIARLDDLPITGLSFCPYYGKLSETFVGRACRGPQS